MNISYEKPPIYEEAKKLFGDIVDTVVFTYGDTLYNPQKANIQMHLIVHEETHARQHEHSESVANLWWKRYLVDPDFRISQEAEAYHNQYEFIKNHTKDRNQTARYLSELALQLSGPIYGRAISYSEAIKLIKNEKGKSTSMLPLP